MGNFRITINAVGGHGQDRAKRNGETVDFEADNTFSPEAILKRAVDDLQAHGTQIAEATIHHWPGSEFEVIDNLITGKRAGNF